MKKNKTIALLLFLVMMVTAVAGCSGTASGTPGDDRQSFTVGCMPLNEPAVQILSEMMEPLGYDVEVVVFDGNHLPAVSLMEGSIDSLILNHLPWINTFNAENDADLVMMEPYVYASLFALYSSRYDSVDEIPVGADIVISGDPTNMDRSLRLLQEIGLIELGEPAGHFYSLVDIEHNPLDLNLIETETTGTARSLNDVDAVVSFTSVMKNAGHDPNAYLFQDGEFVHFPTGLVVDGEDVDQQWVADALSVMQSDAFAEEFNTFYQGAYVLFRDM